MLRSASENQEHLEWLVLHVIPLVVTQRPR